MGSMAARSLVRTRVLAWWLARPAAATALGLALVALLAYGRTISNGGVWDDDMLVLENPHLRSLDGLFRLFTTDIWTASAKGEPSGFYRPLPMATFWIQRGLFGGSAASYHLGNLAIHALNGWLLALLARRAGAARWGTGAVVSALWIAAPVCSEPVYWISGRFDLLTVTFALLALIGRRFHSWRGVALTVVSVACGLLSKEVFFGWLPVLALDDLLRSRSPFLGAPERHFRRRARLPEYALVAAVVLLYLVARRAVGVPSLSATTGTGMQAMGKAVLFLIRSFLSQLFWPIALDPFRPYVDLPWPRLLPGAAELGLIVFIGLAASARRRENTRGSVIGVGCAWFVLTTIPSALAGARLDMVGDRYAYLPVVGLFLAVATAAGWLASRAPARIGPRIAPLAAGAVLLAEVIVTRRRASDWSDDRALAESSLRSSPENPYALYSLGASAAVAGRLDEADALLARSLDGNARSWRTWNAICFLRLNQDRLHEGERACVRSLELNGLNPRTWVNLASIHVRAKRWREAIDAAKRALALKPAFAEAEYLVAVSAANLGDAAMGARHLQRGLALDPGHPGLLDLLRQMEARGVLVPVRPGP